MKPTEIEITVDESGRLSLPVELLNDISIIPGDTVKLAYTASGSVCGNDYKRFTLTSEKEDGDDSDLALPHDVLEAAEISEDADLDLICVKGAVVITAGDLLDGLPDELRRLFDELGIDPDTVRDIMREGHFEHE